MLTIALAVLAACFSLASVFNRLDSLVAISTSPHDPVNECNGAIFHHP
jgi:hypothetical protein